MRNYVILKILALVSFFYCSVAFSAPVPLVGRGIANTHPTSEEIDSVLSQTFSGIQDLLGGVSCRENPVARRIDAVDVINGSFTRKGSIQKIINLFYCGNGNNFSYNLVAVIEDGRVKSAFTVEGTGTGIELGPDINNNGTRTVMIHQYGSGAGMFSDRVSLIDYSDINIKQYGPFNFFEQYPCLNDTSNSTQYAKDQHAIFIDKNKTIKFYQTVSKIGCGDKSPKEVIRLAAITAGKNGISVVRIPVYADVTLPQPLIGSTSLLEKNPLCEYHLCRKISTVRLDQSTEFIIYGIQSVTMPTKGNPSQIDLAERGIMNGLFTLRVKGINRAIGYYSTGQSQADYTAYNDPLFISKNTLNIFIGATVGKSSMHSADSLLTNRPNYHPTVNQDKIFNVSLGNNVFFSNIPNKDGVDRASDSFYVNYVVDKIYLPLMLKHVNASDSSKLAAIKLELLKYTHAKPTNNCPDGQLEVGNGNNFAQNDYFQQFFRNRGMVTVENPGTGAIYYHIPGLGVNKIAIFNYSDQIDSKGNGELCYSPKKSQ